MYLCMLLFMSLIPPWIDIAVDHQAMLKQFEYLNHMNPHTFEVDDLDRLIRSVNLIATSCHKECWIEDMFTLFQFSFQFIISTNCQDWGDKFRPAPLAHLLFKENYISY